MFRAIGLITSIRQTLAPAVEACRWVNSRLEEYRSIAESNIHGASGRLGLKRGSAASLQNPHIAQAMPLTVALCHSVWPRKRSIVREKKSPRIDCQKQSDARSESIDVGRDQSGPVAHESVVLPKDRLAVAIHSESRVRLRPAVQYRQHVPDPSR